MEQTQTKHVDFTADNIAKCQCTNCPVQRGSACAADKKRALQGMQGAQLTASPKDVPNVYCSQGTASCGDLDFSQGCVCPTCQVWQANGLANYKYCRNGSAETNG